MDTHAPNMAICSDYRQDFETEIQEHADYLICLIEQGDLKELQSFIHSFENEAEFFASVVSRAAKNFKHPTLEILPCVAQAANPGVASKHQTFALLTISLTSPSYCKLISICTNRRWETRVLAGPMNRGLVSFRPALDDPSILMRQIGGLARVGDVTPPPAMANQTEA